MMVAGAAHAQASNVTDGLKSTIDQVITIVTDPKYKENSEARRQKLRTIINPKFNYVEMGKRSLSHEWKKLTPKQRKEFVGLFEKLLENSYAAKIESYQNEQINYLDEIIKGKYAMVKTEVVRKAEAVGVDYKLLKTNNQWQVYDFIIEGVSMIRNYRSQFSKIIRKDSFQALLDKMSKKVSELETGPDSGKEL
jgi:phospholipid transport system substrate-binding protein